MPQPKTIAITTENLRDNLPTVRSGLTKGTRYVLLYRERPIAEIGGITKEVDMMFFDDKYKIPKINPNAEKIKKKVAARKKERLHRK
ncbi:hypothetical protein KJ652_06640 [Patescibacteria group bacterium]|nr:hypothetical protein [Patescibacteria group bacterium]